MKTKEFFDLLENHPNKSLVFEYAPNKFVGANYHITEVKHVRIDSVDCGAQTSSWNETIVQLWESPMELAKTEFMSAYKALGILKKVARMRTFDDDAELRFEYSNEKFHTAQLFVSDYLIKDKNLVVLLAVKKTDCKAKELCGVPEPVLVSDNTESCCSPESGCC